MADNSTLYSILIAIAVAAGLAYYFYSSRDKKGEAAPGTPGGNSNTLQLQAYERLILLTDRIAIPNLVSRTNHTGMTAGEMQFILTKTIRDEFDFNITQQMYVSAETWKALKNLKETNLLIINQVAASLDADASALDLNRALLQFSMNDNRGSLHELVSEALSFEAKKLL